MRILVYGAGIQGSFLAHSLKKNKENEVTILARGQRKSDIETNGLVLSHVLQRKNSVDKINVIDTLKSDDFYDYIFVTMKYNDFPSVIEFLAKNSSKKIIFVGNQMDSNKLKEQLLQQSLFPKVIIFGFQITGGTRKNNNMTVLRFGKGEIKVGDLSENPFIRTELSQIFKGTNYIWKEDVKLDDWLKSHATLIMVLNSLDYLFDNNLKKARRNPELLEVASQSFQEAFVALEKSGYAVLPKSLGNLLRKPKIAKLFLRILYATPILKMAQGNFAEIAAIIHSFYSLTAEEYSTPNLDSLLNRALEKYDEETTTSTIILN